MLRVAIIDLGTNTFNLLIADVDTAKNVQTLYTTKLPVNLGEGGINQNIIAPAAFERGINALRQYRKIILEHEADRVYAFATSAVRGAKNKNDFATAARKTAEINIDIISGEREAELICKGVQRALNVGEQPALIMDIGGGSTEFIIATNKKILWKQSYLLGVSRLLQKFNPSDPIKLSEIDIIEKHLEAELQSLFNALEQNPVTELIGASGSFDSFAEIIANKFHSPQLLEGTTEYVFNMSECDTVFRQLIQSNKQKRLQIKGLVEMRVDMIVLSAILVKFVIQKAGIKNMRLSAYSLKEGVIAEIIEGF